MTQFSHSINVICCQKINLEEFGEELAAKLRTIVEECLKPESHRPEMKLVLSILRGEVTSNWNKVELYCVGTGTGTTGKLMSTKSIIAKISRGREKKKSKGDW